MVDERRRNELAVGGLDCSGDRAGVRHIPRPGATARLFRLVSRLLTQRHVLGQIMEICRIYYYKFALLAKYSAKNRLYSPLSVLHDRVE